MINNIPKSQFLRLRKICSETSDYIRQCNSYIQYFVDRGYDCLKLRQQAKELLSKSQNDILFSKKNDSKDPQTILVTTWHPRLKLLPEILRQSYHYIEKDQKLKEIFKKKPIVAFRKKKSLANHLVRSDIIPPKAYHFSTNPCNNCRKMCHLINTSNILNNKVNGRKVNLTVNGNCKSKNIVYAARCKVHGLLYIGHTGEQLKDRFSKHRYDAKNRPDNNKLAHHIHHYHHDFDHDIDVTILKDNLNDTKAREKCEDKYICLLGIKQPSGLNSDMGQYGTDMYETYQNLLT